MLPEHQQWKIAVQAAAVMLRTPPIDGQSSASHHANFPHMACNFENAPPRHPPVTGQQHAQTPPSILTMSSYRVMDASL